MPTQKYCQFCAKSFQGRTNKKFCSDSCRVQHNRLPATIQKLKKDALVSVSKMRRVAREFPHVANDVKNALEDIVDSINLHQI